MSRESLGTLALVVPLLTACPDKRGQDPIEKALSESGDYASVRKAMQVRDDAQRVIDQWESFAASLAYCPQNENEQYIAGRASITGAMDCLDKNDNGEVDHIRIWNGNGDENDRVLYCVAIDGDKAMEDCNF